MTIGKKNIAYLNKDSFSTFLVTYFSLMSFKKTFRFYFYFLSLADRAINQSITKYLEIIFKNVTRQMRNNNKQFWSKLCVRFFPTEKLSLSTLFCTVNID